ncbi:MULTISPECIES: acetyl/propionyl/methylcrotonyl-CoA carboxylase subunit alpha [Micrococcus]|uniref:acetyl/propionyl/methylcrotonyl-CoA carboxylase subunit alpha n=2 Tax=Micrococcus TaxID=1269 RepID=UPI0019D1993D|nr:biotin carboxylase N-terminal domain-containing protein [Micrococcus luteus]MBN6768864.1 ATP-grasp domain-containing protein [Micrococcus luteus]MBN6829020.1 ATP-grasp domain-containing protein [Micrococcus luteus]MBN6845965.1 ATP-grasp domain-containing protein [Micrococcus luteus]MBN6862597.1 ATP-grasp domain-containing protein [Micrococcus luteus]MBN6865524.1 ATP-grasp domain-containing protein [Micrococcus luteus]
MSIADAPQASVVPPVDPAAERRFSRVLIANRGEIAVRIIRACQDEGLTSVAVYAEPDRDALHVRLADEAVALGGETAADSYLVIGKILDAAERAGADAVHPGYGFLSENADFARAVTDAGLVWIGPPAEAIDRLGDKVSARQLATKVGAPLAPGTTSPVTGTEEVVAFADEFGLPVAIKAAYGGGGRGIKVARTREEIPEFYESAVREAVAAFGRGECFVERFLDKPRHVETQCLADVHGDVVVISTRDCSLQRRNQKLVEEAPAPFLTDEQNARLVESSKAILQEAGYVGAGTCEFLVGQDGTISFLEVNTRLQVEHPVSEEITGIDLVREQFRLARGEALGYTDPQPRGHSIEFRLNGEDPGRNFLPAPGRLTTFRMPSGPGVRVDSGVVEGETVSGAFDSMVAKLIVTGADRRQALQRAARALREAEIVGMPSVLPFHRAVVRDPAFAPEIAGSEEPLSVHTRWIETEFANHIEPSALTPAEPAPREARHTVTVEVNGKRVDVTLPTWGEALHTISGAAQRAGAGRRRPRGKRGAPVAAAVSTDALTAPMQGTVVKVAAENGQTVAEGDLIVVVEAMKMEQPLTAHRAGVVSGLGVEPGQTVTAGTVVATIADAE